MDLKIDKNNIRKMVFMIVERWSGGSLSKTDRQVLEDFMEDEVEPLGGRELLNRTGTSAQILEWFMTYIQTRVLKRCCGSASALDGELVCCPS